MVRLVFFGIVIVVAVVAWLSKQAAGAVTGNQDLQNTTFKGQTQKTMDSAARGVNWLEKQWEEAKSDANKGKGAASREFKNYDK
jgi:nitrogen fixation protein FixH